MSGMYPGRQYFGPRSVNPNLSDRMRGLLDTIASTETDQKRPDGGYGQAYHTNTTFDVNDPSTYNSVGPISSGPNGPNGRRLNSSAKGRYQFMGPTISEYGKIDPATGVPSYAPADQDTAAATLATDRYAGGLEADLGDPSKYGQIGSSLSGTWTSMPGGIEQNRVYRDPNAFSNTLADRIKNYTDRTYVATADPQTLSAQSLAADSGDRFNERANQIAFNRALNPIEGTPSFLQSALSTAAAPFSRAAGIVGDQYSRLFRSPEEQAPPRNIPTPPQRPPDNLTAAPELGTVTGRPLGPVGPSAGPGFITGGFDNGTQPSDTVAVTGFGGSPVGNRPQDSVSHRDTRQPMGDPWGNLDPGALAPTAPTTLGAAISQATSPSGRPMSSFTPQQQALGQYQRNFGLPGLANALPGEMGLPQASPALQAAARPAPLAAPPRAPLSPALAALSAKPPEANMASPGRTTSMLAGPTPQGLLSQGNIDLNSRPTVRNPDGSISTVRSMSFQDEEGGPEILAPTVSPQGTIMSNKEAINQYHMTGQYLGAFDNPDNADKYAESLHNQQAGQYGAPQPAQAPAPFQAPQRPFTPTPALMAPPLPQQMAPQPQAPQFSPAQVSNPFSGPPQMPGIPRSAITAGLPMPGVPAPMTPTIGNLPQAGTVDPGVNSTRRPTTMQNIGTAARSAGTVAKGALLGGKIAGPIGMAVGAGIPLAGMAMSHFNTNLNNLFGGPQPNPGSAPATMNDLAPGSARSLLGQVNRMDYGPAPVGQHYAYSPFGNNVSLQPNTQSEFSQIAGTGPGLLGAFGFGTSNNGYNNGTAAAAQNATKNDAKASKSKTDAQNNATQGSTGTSGPTGPSSSSGSQGGSGAGMSGSASKTDKNKQT